MEAEGVSAQLLSYHLFLKKKKNMYSIYSFIIIVVVVIGPEIAPTGAIMLTVPTPVPLRSFLMPRPTEH